MQSERSRSAHGRGVSSGGAERHFQTTTTRSAPVKGTAIGEASGDLQRKLKSALDADPELAPGIERSMVRAFWSRTPLAAHSDPRVIAGLPLKP